MIEAKDDNANPLSAPLAGSEALLVVQNGVFAKIQHFVTALVDGACTSTIDVDAAVGPRLNFVDETAGVGVAVPFASGDTDLTHSQAALLVSNTAEYGLTLNANDMYTLSVKRSDVNGVASIAYDGNAMTPGTNEWTITTDFGVSDPVAVALEILITVNEVDVLNAGTWTVDLTIDPDQDANEPRDLAEMTLLADENAFNWSINGWQSVYPYFNARNMYGSYIVLNNNSSTNGKVFFDVISSSDAGVRGNLANYCNKQVTGKEELVAGESQVYLMSDLLEALGLAGSDAKRNALLVTVTAPVSGVTGTAFMDDPGSGGKRTMPLLTYDGNANEYRQW